MTADFQNWLGNHLFTPSELEDYPKCPFGFYLRSFLRIQPTLTSAPELTPTELGTLVHRTLEQFFRVPGRSEAQLLQIVGIEFARIKESRPQLIPVLVENQQARVETTLKEFLKLETPLQPTYFEWSFGKKTPPLVIPDRFPIRLEGRIDRIDVDEKNRRFLVIDYKTGSTKISGNRILQGEVLQLPLYILAVQSLLLPDYEPIGGLYYHLSDLSLDTGIVHAERIPDRIVPRPSSIIPVARWDSLFTITRQRVKEIVGKIRDEIFPAAAESCQPWCPYQDVCKLRRLKE